jgi:hypothetical protein
MEGAFPAASHNIAFAELNRIRFMFIVSPTRRPSRGDFWITSPDCISESQVIPPLWLVSQSDLECRCCHLCNELQYFASHS